MPQETSTEKDDSHMAFHNSLVRNAPGLDLSILDHPHSDFVYPVFKEVNDFKSDVVALLTASLAWDVFVVNLLPDGVRGIILVLDNTCVQQHTYEVDGSTAVYMGEGDLHDRTYSKTDVAIPFYLVADDRKTPLDGECLYTFHLYASKDF